MTNAKIYDVKCMFVVFHGKATDFMICLNKNLLRRYLKINNNIVYFLI